MITSQRTAVGGYLHGGPVGFGEAITQAFRNGFVYQGRASRSAYWWFNLFQAMVTAALIVVIALLASSANAGASVAAALVITIAAIPLALVGLSLLVRRLHDTGRSGWWVLIPAVPFVGGLILFVLTVLDGTPGPNRYEPAS